MWNSHWVPFLCIFFLRGMVCMNVCHRKLVTPHKPALNSHVVMQPVSATGSIEPKWNLTDIQCWQENYPSNSTDQCDTWALGQKEMLRVLLQVLLLVSASTILPKAAPHTHKAQTQKCAHLSHQFWYLFRNFKKIGKQYTLGHILQHCSQCRSFEWLQLRIYFASLQTSFWENSFWASIHFSKQG